MPRTSPQAPSYKRAGTPWWAWTAGALAVIGALGIGIYFARSGKEAVMQPLPAAVVPGTPAQISPAAAIQHPIDEANTADAGDAPALPPLDASDAPVLEALGALAGANALTSLLNPQHVIQRIVATVDSLPRQKLAPDALPVRGAQGAFGTTLEGDKRTIDAKNSARYAAYARIAQAIDAKTLVTWYVRFYPLFQQAYRELGYPDGYFNDRLVVVIDHLLATPDLSQPIALTQPNVMYEFADPALESRSAGQKLLLRSGPENEAAIKAKLREIRAALTGQDIGPEKG
jgi:hypothetical protein